MVKKSNRQLWTEHVSRLNGEKSKNLKLVDNELKLAKRGYSGVILGIDPSLRGTGVAVIESNSQNCRFIFSKRLTIANEFSFYDCLGKLYNEISIIVDRFHPTFAAMEQTIFVQNYRVAQILGSVRGAMVAALVNKGLQITEYPPLRIKQAITGVGRASKEQVFRTVKNILSIDGNISYDESDALAVACCHAWTFTITKGS